MTSPKPDPALAGERAAIDAAVDGETLGSILARNADLYWNEPALSWKHAHDDPEWQRMTWKDYRERVAEAALGLRKLGVGPGDHVAIMARNMPEHLIADLAAVHLGATAVSLYNTLAPEQIQYVAGHCEAKVAVVETREFMERWEKVKAELPALEHVVMISDADDFADYEWVSSWSSLLTAGQEELAKPEGREAFESAWKATTPDDVATLIYTSGTTGPPKGVVLTHRNVIWTAASIDKTGAYPAGLRGVSYLPLAHALERLATHYLSLYKAANVHFCPEVLQVFEYVPTVRPQAFAGVPRLFEKLQAGILAGINEEPNERRRRIALGAVQTGQEAARREREGTPVPFGMKVKRAAFDKLVFSKIRDKVGLDQCMFTVTGAAPMAPDTHDFFAGIGLPLYEGYGMTESSAPATLNLPGRRKAGSVGPRLPGVEIALAGDGEVLIRGDNVTSGYYREPEKTAETVDGDGWLHTGDIGRLDVEGFLFIVDRKKELVVTSGGKNISPANIEALLKSHPLIGQAAAIGDGRKYMSALIVLDAEASEQWAKDNGVPFTDVASFAREDRVKAEIQHAVDEVNQRLSQVEAIKRWTILPTEWTVDSEELTPTLKLKRRVINEKYHAEIEQLYS
ncbi:MAG TPA: long-chain fatty acid--CoA ligase [Actinomycetota bacterium]|nr:long-chain fatty acid--CoA ligase [Actinomycetota bacterium]